MIAPLIPRLASIFNVSVQEIGFIVPIYMLAYALMALFYGILSDRFGRWSIIRLSLIIFAWRIWSVLWPRQGLPDQAGPLISRGGSSSR